MSYAISVREMDETPALVMRRAVRPEDLGDALADMLPAVFVFAQQAGLALAGAPFVRYTAMDEDGFTIEAGLPLEETADGGGEGERQIHPTTLPGGKAAMTVHRGPYQELGGAHQALERWLEANELEATGPRWESYINDPEEVGDPAEYLTEVFVPIG